MTIWCFGKSGKLILSTEVVSMESARKLAREWNRGNKVSAIEIIANAANPAHATSVTAVA